MPKTIGDVLGTATLHNTTAHTHSGIAEFVLPLPRGEVTNEHWRIGIETGGVATAIGARWPDGSVRFMLVRLPVVVPAHTEQRVTLTWAETLPGFHTPEPLLRALHAFDYRFMVGEKSARLNHRERLIVEDGVALTYRSRVRVDNIWAEMIATLYSGQMYARFSIQFGYSPAAGKRNPQTIKCPEIRLSTKGAHIAFTHAEAKVPRQAQGGNGDDSTVATLYGGGPLAAGQGSACGGVLLFWAEPWRHLVGEAQVQTLLAERERPILSRATADTWAASEAFGPFGQLLEERTPPRTLVDGYAYRDYLRCQDHVFELPQRGCDAYAPRTGEQPDFGVVKLRRIVTSDATIPLYLVDRSVHQEACRPTHEREGDVEPFRFTLRPNALMSDGRPNHRIDPGSVDMLGYDPNSKRNAARSPPPKSQEWMPHDREHLSLNYLCAYTLVTGNAWAYQECEHKAELWLAEFNQDRRRGRWVVAARAVGRPLAAACWLWLVTGREDLRKAIEAHATYHQQQYNKRGRDILAPRNDGEYWVPWEEACAAYGLAMVHRLFHHSAAGQLSRLLAEKVTRDGIGVLDGRTAVAYKPPIETAAGKTWSAQDSAELRRHLGPSMLSWALPALVIAWKRGADAGIRHRAHYLLSRALKPLPDPESDVWDWLALEGFAPADLESSE